MNIALARVQKYLDWIKTKLYLDSTAVKASKRVVKRGEVYFCEFGIGIGSEQEKVRPCVILQNDIGNINSPNTIIAPITNSPGTPAVTVEIKNQYNYNNGNDQLTGYILLGNIITVSKARLGDNIAILLDEMNEIDDKILVSLSLFKQFKKLKDTIQTDKAFIPIPRLHLLLGGVSTFLLQWG